MDKILTKEEILKGYVFDGKISAGHCLDAMELYAQQFERPDNDSGQGWISISEKPNLERNGEVYVVMNIIVWDKVEQCSYALNYSKLSGFNNSDITHWQYFPGAPNESK